MRLLLTITLTTDNSPPPNRKSLRYRQIYRHSGTGKETQGRTGTGTETQRQRQGQSYPCVHLTPIYCSFTTTYIHTTPTHLCIVTTASHPRTDRHNHYTPLHNYSPFTGTSHPRTYTQPLHVCIMTTTIHDHFPVTYQPTTLIQTHSHSQPTHSPPITSHTCPAITAHLSSPSPVQTHSHRLSPYTTWQTRSYPIRFCPPTLRVHTTAGFTCV